MKTPRFLKISAVALDYDDAIVNGIECNSGDTIPFMVDNVWNPVVDIQSGMIVDWPSGVTAEFHFKVCDQGNYYLLDDDGCVIAERIDNYVPHGLCHGDKGYGDYIIFNVDGHGNIEGYVNSVDICEFELIGDR